MKINCSTIIYEQLKYYGHMGRMNEEMLPKKSLEWCLPGRRRRKGRSRNLWMKEITTGKIEKGNNNMEGIEREEKTK